MTARSDATLTVRVPQQLDTFSRRDVVFGSIRLIKDFDGRPSVTVGPDQPVTTS